MVRLLSAGLLWAAAVALGQGIDAKAKAAEYPVHAEVGGITIGAENWGHGLTTPLGSFTVNDYIVVEVALYSEGNKPFTVSTGQFTLRLNGRRTLVTQAPNMAAASVKYPDWESHPELVGTAGVNGTDVILGRPAPVERFPGDPTRRPTVNGPVPRAPEDQTGVRTAQPPKVEEVFDRAAMPVGEIHPPAAGFLFFHYPGKVKTLKKVELVYEGPTGSASLVFP